MEVPNFYYAIKPLIPRRFLIALRSQVIRRQLVKYKDVWPIDPTTWKTPAGWPGWPEGKQFALVLTHDVEGTEGLAKVRPLAELEMKYGFRSSFNFVPGDYVVSLELREFLVSNGFEVGVHGYTHKQGNLFRSEKIFKEQAPGINRFLKEWGAVGFRAPSMYHDFEKIQRLEIQYDSSTFDTDPFEPQPDGVRTIFPFWVSNRNGGGFVELPCTMPQDHTLFLLMKEKTIQIWRKKLDWIARQGGMALLITHPDYFHLELNNNKSQINISNFYEEFLNDICIRHENQYWKSLPKDIAKFLQDWNKNVETKIFSPFAKEEAFPKPMSNKSSTTSANKGRIWIDLDNTPHVPFFMPIIKELRRQGFDILLTARDCAQTCGMADLYNLEYKRIGRHYGKNTMIKVAGTLLRAAQLLKELKDPKPILALSHGSRAQLVSASILRIPSMVILDYEHAKALVKPNWVMMPEVISYDSVSFDQERILRYPGIKEDVYVPDFHPDPAIKYKLGILKNDILVTIRPPANQAHYHNPESEKLFAEAVNRLGIIPNVCMVILPRNEGQKEEIKKTWSGLFADEKIKIPDQVVDGLNLLWFSDLVISGGGTMNREAAALGVPVYSIFRGKIGDVDKYLSGVGRLIMIESLEDIHQKLKVVKRSIPDEINDLNRATLNSVVQNIQKVVDMNLKP
jgi:uncharacterized protein